jgi:hypothetical protein
MVLDAYDDMLARVSIEAMRSAPAREAIVSAIRCVVAVGDYESGMQMLADMQVFAMSLFGSYSHVQWSVLVCYTGSSGIVFHEWDLHQYLLLILCGFNDAEVLCAHAHNGLALLRAS